MVTWGDARSASENTATVSIPSSRQARKIRIAISPRFATSSLMRSERYVSVLLLRQHDALALQEPESGDEPLARLRRLDDVVDVAAAGGDVGIGEIGHVLVDLARPCLRRGVGSELALVED